jgi:pyruvate kinase
LLLDKKQSIVLPIQQIQIRLSYTKELDTMPRTKIIATLGPASSNYTVLRKMFTAGLDVVRLNFSHGSHKRHLDCIDLVRRLNKKYRRHIRIMQDLEGFRIRVGRFKGAKTKVLKQRTVVWLTNDTGDHGPRTIPLDYKGDLDRIKPEHFIYIDDGKLALRVKRRAASLIKPRLPDCRLVAKIENRQAIENIDGIIDAADGIMVARGDMGVAIPIYEVPIIQKRIIKKCNAAKKFVITATQMLEHMTEHSRPTRAEVADVANAIIDGTDFVMLSGETAVGRFPYQSVLMMNEIIKFTEKTMSGL